MTKAEAPGAERYRIGQVSRMTGVPPETLRSWESRHDAVRPERTAGGFRLYASHDVERLTLIRALTERGHPVGTIARLDANGLRNRLRRDPGTLLPRELPSDGGERLSEASRGLLSAMRELRELVGGEGADRRFGELLASLSELERRLRALVEVEASVDP